MTPEIMRTLEKLIGAVDAACNSEENIERNCAAQDGREYLRRAWCALGQFPCVDNDTTIEMDNRAGQQLDGR